MNVQMSKLGLGCWSFGTDRYWGEQSHKDTIKTIQAALRGGINHFDTAGVYANGRSEQVTGQQLKKIREKVIIATKAFYHPPEKMQKVIDTSLRRLCTDYIDIFYLHWPSPAKDFGPLIEILEKNKTSGKIHAIGISNFTIEQIKPLLDYGRIDYYQTGYSLLWRQPERTVIPFCLKNSIRIITYSSIAQGVLTDKFISSSGFRKDDPRNNLVFLGSSVRLQLLTLLKELQNIAREIDITVTQLSLVWLLSRPWVTSVLAGARNRKQVEENMKAIPIQTNSDILKTVTRLSDLFNEYLPDADNIFNHNPGAGRGNSVC